MKNVVFRLGFLKKKIFLMKKKSYQKHIYQVSNINKIFPFGVSLLLYVSVEKSFNHATCEKTDSTKKRGKMDHKYTILKVFFFFKRKVWISD